MINVLLYLFSHQLMDEETLTENRIEIQQELALERFHPLAINQAMDWLKVLWEELSGNSRLDQIDSQHVRIWSAEEIEKLGSEGLGFLSQLENQGIITAWQREVVIDRALAIHTPRLEVEHLKCIVLIVFYYQQEEGVSLPWVEHILSGESIKMH